MTNVEGIKINQGFIGSCTNSRQEYLEIAASILKGRKVHPEVRLIISPASVEFWKDAPMAGWLTIFINAEACITHPTCGPCIGSHQGILAAGERCISSTNINFKGRMGSSDSDCLSGKCCHGCFILFSRPYNRPERFEDGMIDIIHGRVWKFGDNISTDLMLPGYATGSTPEEVAKFYVRSGRTGRRR